MSFEFKFEFSKKIEFCQVCSPDTNSQPFVFVYRLLAKGLPAVNEFDAVVNHFPLNENDKNQIAFVGNGKIGAVADYEKPSLSILYEKIENKDQKTFKTSELLRFVIILY